MRRQFNLEEFMGTPNIRKGYPSHGREWYGNQTTEQIADRAIMGDDSLVAKAEELLGKLNAEIELQHSEWIPSVYGAYPNVPEFLAGSPTPMRHRVQVPTDNSPIGIWVDLTSSGGLGFDVIMKRGVVVMALVLKLQQIRAIELHVCCALPGDSNGGTWLDVVMPTQPLQVGVVCHVLTCVGFARDLMYGWAVRTNRSGLGRVIQSLSEFRSFGQIPENDIAISGSHLYDFDKLQDSVKWIQGMLDKYCHREDED